MITREIKVWIGAAQGIIPPVKVSQYDTEWQFQFTVYKDDVVWDMSGVTTITMNGVKEDGTAFVYTGSKSGIHVVVNCGEQMTSAPGRVECELRFADSNGLLISTANFRLLVEPAPLTGYVSSKSEFDELNQLANTVLSQTGGIEGLAARVDSLQASIGSPAKAATAAAMTDHSKIYVYTGSESGMETGHWYYYDSGWQDGGVYQAAAVETDTNLTQAGMAADGKAAGDQIAAVKAEVDGYLTVSQPEAVTDWQQGGISTTGARGTAANRCRSFYYHFDNRQGNILYFTVKSGYAVSLRIYSSASDAGYVTYTSFYSAGTHKYKINPDYYYRFLIKLVDDADFTPGDLPDDAFLYSYAEMMPSHRVSHLEWFEQGGIGGTTGVDNTKKNRIKTKFLPETARAINIASGYEAGFAAYTALGEYQGRWRADTGGISLTDLFSNPSTGAVDLTPYYTAHPGWLLRLVLRHSDSPDASIGIADGINVTVLESLGQIALGNRQELNEMKNRGGQDVIYAEHLVGGFIGANGQQETPCVTAEQQARYFKTYHTAKMLRAVNIVDIDGLTENEAVTVYCYNDACGYLGSVSDYSGIQDKYGATRWIIVEVSSSTAYDGQKDITISAISDYPYPRRRSSGYSGNSNGPTTRRFSFEVQLPVFDEDVDTTDPNLLRERHYDNGELMLPPNYDPEDPAKAVPLVICCHGTGGFDPFWTNAVNGNFKSYTAQLRYLALCGYAVAECSCFSDKYMFSEVSTDASAVAAANSRFTPVSAACYIALHKHLMQSYNLRADGCYVFGKSNGGLATVWLGMMQPFKVRAIGSLAGSLSVPMSMRFTKASTIQYWIDRFGIDLTVNVPSTKYLYEVETAEIKQALAAAHDRYKRYDPMSLFGTNGAELTEELFSYSYNTLSQDWARAIAVAESSGKHLPCPMKIWHAVDDTDVPIVYSRIFKTMVDNWGGVCYLREFPAGCGAHHAVDTADNAPKVSLVPDYWNAERTVPVAYAELVEWFRRW